MWVEADCNLISGESMIRQILFGKRFFREEFGKESEILWLPDVFGYSAMMPQILKKTGVSAFVTSKISWNDTNMMPHDTFLWQGIDGTEIFSYFLTAQDSHLNNPVRYTTYVGNITPRQVLGTWERYQDKAYNSSVALTYGYGDGGGGPTEEMLEAQRRTARKIPGIPKTVPAHPSEFIKTAKENFEKTSSFCRKHRAGSVSSILKTTAEHIPMPQKIKIQQEERAFTRQSRGAYGLWHAHGQRISRKGVSLALARCAVKSVPRRYSRKLDKRGL